MRHNSFSTRIVVIALDGLEYTLVKSGQFPNLKQIEFGKVQVPITSIGEPSTPIIWTSFVTGKMPCEHGINRPTVYKNRLVDTFSTHLPTKLLRRSTIFLSPIQHLLNKLSLLETEMPQKNELKSKTIFQEVENSISIDVPVLDKDVATKYKGFIDAVVNQKKRQKFLLFLLKDFSQVKEKLIKSIESNYLLVMAHFQITDLYGHIYCRQQDKLLELYKKMDNFVNEIKNLLPPDCLLLVISDHGIDKNYGHSPYGFYSTNKHLNLNNPHIINFYDIILSELQQ